MKANSARQKRRVELNLSMHRSIRHWAMYQPEKVAVIASDSTISYGALERTIVKCRELLDQCALRRQSVIGVLVQDKSSFIAAISAALAESHVPAFVNLALEAPVVRSMIRDASCKALLVDPAGRNLAPRRIDLPMIDIPAFDRGALGPIFSPDPAPRYVDDVWGIIYSSGTTGKPKGIVRTDLSMLNELLGWSLELPLRKDSTTFIGRPIYYTGGLVLAGATLLVGGSVILPREWSVESYRSIMDAHSVDLAFLIPDQVQELVDAKLQDSSPWPFPRTILTMGAPISPELKARVLETLGSSYLESWGNSEGLGTITQKGDARSRPTSVGKPFLADELFVVDARGHRLPSGTVGQLAGRADSVLSGYRNRRDLNRKFIRDRLVISEDLGYMDQDGYFYLVGRTSQRLLRNGVPIFTIDIENAIRRSPNIRDVAVVGLDQTAHGQVPAAVVALRNDEAIAEAELLAMINHSLAFTHQLTRVRIISELPRNAAGKVDYEIVKQMLAPR